MKTGLKPTATETRGFYARVLCALLEHFDVEEDADIHHIRVFGLAAASKKARLVTDLGQSYVRYSISPEDPLADSFRMLFQLQRALLAEFDPAVDGEIACLMDDQLLLRIAYGIQSENSEQPLSEILELPDLHNLCGESELDLGPLLTDFEPVTIYTTLTAKVVEGEKNGVDAFFVVDNDLVDQQVKEASVEASVVRTCGQMLSKGGFRDWHLEKPLRDEHDRLTESIKDPKFVNFVARYGASIEGELAGMTDPIVVEKEVKKPKNTKTKNGETKSGSKAADIILNNIVKKYRTELSTLLEMKPVNPAGYLAKAKKKYGDFREDIAKNGLWSNNSQALQELLEEYQKLLATEETEKWRKLFFEINLNDRDRSLAAEVTFLTSVKTVLAPKGSHGEKDLRSLKGRLYELGYKKFADAALPSIKVSDDCSIARADRCFLEFQLNHMGSLMERKQMSTKDPRISSFNPDQWQRDMFDAVDRGQSALIIAPTSSGKTYACYYAMEKVLRESDDGIVVYVAPTKALVNQVAATIYARFAKRKNLPAGRHLLGMFTRDYRDNALNCQILVTLPQCLEILLLSAAPGRKKWSDRLRYVIFDEVHNIASENSPETWERVIMRVRCPILALSATVANPTDLHAWLQQLEDMKKMQDQELGVTHRAPQSYQTKLIVHKDRHSDLVKYVAQRTGEAGELGLAHAHPYALLKMSDLRRSKSVPSHIGLSPKETLQLYQAMNYAFAGHGERVTRPEDFFGQAVLSRNDVAAYYSKLRESFIRLLETEQWGPVARIQSFLQMAIEAKKAAINPGKNIFTDFSKLAWQLKEENMLPALVFCFDRSGCEYICQELMIDCNKAIKAIKTNPRVVKKMAEQEKLQSKSMYKRQLKKEKDKETETPSSHQLKLDAAVEFFLKLASTYPSSVFARPQSFNQDDAWFIYRRLRFCADRVFRHSLRYGLSWHHAGNDNKMRSATEMLFRQGFLQMITATTTLAQGIHMPCKTVVFFQDEIYLNSLNYHQCSGRAGRRGFDAEGNVIFFNVPEAKVKRLVTAMLPKILGNDPINITVILKLFIMIGNAECIQDRAETVAWAACLLKNPMILQSRPEVRTQLDRFFFSRLVAHLHYYEPYNFAFCHVLRSEALHELCVPSGDGTFPRRVMEDLIVVLSHFFARRPLNLAEHKRMCKEGLKRNCGVVLEQLPSTVLKAMKDFNGTLCYCLGNYVRTVAKFADVETELPLSKAKFRVSQNPSESHYGSSFADYKLPEVTSLGLSGLMNNANRNIFTAYVQQLVEQEGSLNRYALDFFLHNKKDVCHDNGIPTGDIFQLTKDFLMTIQTIRRALWELKTNKSWPTFDSKGPTSPIHRTGDPLVDAMSQLAAEYKRKFEDQFKARLNDM